MEKRGLPSATQSLCAQGDLGISLLETQAFPASPAHQRQLPTSSDPWGWGGVGVAGWLVKEEPILPGKT